MTFTLLTAGIDLSVGGSGDPSPMTAWGVFQGVKASVRWLDGSEDLSGKTVAVQGGRVLIDGQLLEEPWTTRPGGPSYPATVVPAMHVFVLGDNRGSSRDSRSFGPVALEQVIGRAWFVYWPLDQVKLVGANGR